VTGRARVVLAAWLAHAAVVLVVGSALAASPSPVTGGDPRSSGQGPGLVGDPVVAILIVVGIGVVALVATLAYIRLTGGRRS
jgi:hypothetical protein